MNWDIAAALCVVALIIGLFVWYYFKQNTVAGKITRAVYYFATVGLLVSAGSVVGWQKLDARGLIPHSHETDITAEPSWLNGESKVCSSFPAQPENDVTTRILCDKGPDHHIEVRFWGLKSREDSRAPNGVTWKCVKNSESFVCYDLN
jgi:hypothetical protein